MSLEPLASKERVFQGEVNEIQFRTWGRFAVTHVPEKGLVTFSLDRKVWDGEDDPITGEVVLLSKLRNVRRKWRATQANRIKL